MAWRRRQGERRGAPEKRTSGKVRGHARSPHAAPGTRGGHDQNQRRIDAIVQASAGGRRNVSSAVFICAIVVRADLTAASTRLSSSSSACCPSRSRSARSSSLGLTGAIDDHRLQVVDKGDHRRLIGDLELRRDAAVARDRRAWGCVPGRNQLKTSARGPGSRRYGWRSRRHCRTATGWWAT